MALSARGYDRVREVARTIADLAGADAPTPNTSPRRCSSGWSDQAEALGTAWADTLRHIQTVLLAPQVRWIGIDALRDVPERNPGCG